MKKAETLQPSLLYVCSKHTLLACLMLSSPFICHLVVIPCGFWYMFISYCGKGTMGGKRCGAGESQGIIHIFSDVTSFCLITYLCYPVWCDRVHPHTHTGGGRGTFRPAGGGSCSSEGRQGPHPTGFCNFYDKNR